MIIYNTIFAVAAVLVIAAIVVAWVISSSKAKQDLAVANSKLEDLQARLDASQEEAAGKVREAVEEREKAHREAMSALQARFEETIAKVSAQVKLDTEKMLKERQKEFSEASNMSIGQIVNPLKENIAELKKAMAEGQQQQAELTGQLKGHIQGLMEHSEAAKKSADELAEAFKHGSKIQGDWGETILEELLASQGLTKGVHFESQQVIRDAKGNVVKVKDVNDKDRESLRMDIILHLDEQREVIIDSKVSMTAYVDYVNAENEADRKKCLDAHIDSIKKHVKELSKTDYSSYIQPPKITAGYVIMFVPNAGALWTALRAEPGLWRWAADQNVYIADEQSLYGALKIVNLTWKQVAQAQNHRKVYDLADAMIKRVGQFKVQYDALETAIEKLSEVYKEGQKKLLPSGQSIITVANQLIKLGADGKQLLNVSPTKKKPLQEVLGADDISEDTDTYLE